MLVVNVILIILLPIIFFIMLLKTSYKSKLEWIFNTVWTTIFIVWLFQIGNWSWFSYYIRYLLLAALILIIILSWKKVRELPFKVKYSRSQKVSLGFTSLLVAVFSIYNIFVFTSYTTSKQSIELSFPLKEGTSYIGQGGNHPQMNYHQAYEPQKYALDILKINAFGLRANGLYPKELEKYHIYEEEVYSPCNGRVVGMENDLPDHTPPDTDEENATGNHVAINCEETDATVYIAHMQNKSVETYPGENIDKDQVIGKVGNSGNTSEPHLHIHAEKDGTGVPIRFEGKFLVRNQLVK